MVSVEWLYEHPLSRYSGVSTVYSFFGTDEYFVTGWISTVDYVSPCSVPLYAVFA